MASTATAQGLRARTVSHRLPEPALYLIRADRCRTSLLRCFDDLSEYRLRTRASPARS